MPMKQVQIDEALFLKLCRYFAGEAELEDELRSALSEKLDKIIARQLYSTYKTAPSPEERESARLRYLDHARINQSSSVTSL